MASVVYTTASVADPAWSLEPSRPAMRRPIDARVWARRHHAPERLSPSGAPLRLCQSYVPSRHSAKMAAQWMARALASGRWRSKPSPERMSRPTSAEGRRSGEPSQSRLRTWSSVSSGYCADATGPSSHSGPASGERSC